MSDRLFFPYRAMKLDGYWCVTNIAEKIDAACDCRCSAEDLAKEMNELAMRDLEKLENPNTVPPYTETRTDDQIRRDFIESLETAVGIAINNNTARERARHCGITEAYKLRNINAVDPNTDIKEDA